MAENGETARQKLTAAERYKKPKMAKIGILTTTKVTCKLAEKLAEASKNGQQWPKWVEKQSKMTPPICAQMETNISGFFLTRWGHRKQSWPTTDACSPARLQRKVPDLRPEPLLCKAQQLRKRSAKAQQSSAGVWVGEVSVQDAGRSVFHTEEPGSFWGGPGGFENGQNGREGLQNMVKFMPSRFDCSGNGN